MCADFRDDTEDAEERMWLFIEVTTRPPYVGDERRGGSEGANESEEKPRTRDRGTIAVEDGSHSNVCMRLGMWREDEVGASAGYSRITGENGVFYIHRRH